MSDEHKTLGGWIEQAIKANQLEAMMNASSHAFDHLADQLGLDITEIEPADEDQGAIYGLACDPHDWFLVSWSPGNISRQLGDATIHGPLSQTEVIRRFHD